MKPKIVGTYRNITNGFHTSFFFNISDWLMALDINIGTVSKKHSFGNNMNNTQKYVKSV